MRSCPKCNADYFDTIIEFCLEDGERLLQSSESDSEKETIQSFKTFNQKAEAETISLSENTIGESKIDNQNKSNIQDKVVAKSEVLKNTATSHWLKFLEGFPIVIAISHNYLHWLYFEKLKTYNLTDFLTSKIFLFWLFLLILGIIFGIISLKYSKQKGFAIVSLIILAINLLLSVVPK